MVKTRVLMGKSSILISCERASALIEKRKLTGLSFSDRMLLRVHSLICGPCTSYKLQSDVIDDCLQKQSTKQQRMSDANKKELLEGIKNSN